MILRKRTNSGESVKRKRAHGPPFFLLFFSNQMTQYNFFVQFPISNKKFFRSVHRLWISALLCPIKIKFGLSLRYALGTYTTEFNKNQMFDDVIVYSKQSSISQFLLHLQTQFINGTNIQH